MIKKYVEIFKALADETRLRILHLLLHADSNPCVCELTDALDVPQYNISKHLKVLKSAGLVEERKEGRWVYLGVAAGTDSFREAVLNALRHLPDSVLSGDLAEFEKRLSMRVDGKCLLGIQKKHLVGGKHDKEAG